MLIRAGLKNLNGCPVVTLRPEGGILSWQDWMCDGVSLMTLAAPLENGSAPQPGFAASGGGGSDLLPRPISANGRGERSQVRESTPLLGLFSFRSGSILARFTLAPDELKVLWEAHRYVLASDELEKGRQIEGTILKLEPCDQTGSFYKKGLHSQMSGDIKTAIVSYEATLQASPGLPRIRNLLGFCHRLEGRPSEAEIAYQQEIERFPNFPDPYCNLGALYLRTERPQLARALFEQALERDQFFLNALLQMSRFLGETPNSSPRLAAAINYRLLVIFPENPAVQEQLLLLARRAGISTQEFAVKLRVEAGSVTDPQLLRLMKRLESLRLNGAYLAVVRGFGLLLEKSKNTNLAGFFQHWVGKRLALFPSNSPGFLQPALDKTQSELVSSFPTLVQSSPISESPQIAPAGVNGEEFYELILEEVLQDGQITPAEYVLLGRLRHALRIDESLHQQIFARAASFASLPLADGGEDFDPRRFLKKLALAISRDGKLDTQEQKLLELAGEVLGLPIETLTSALSEANL